MIAADFLVSSAKDGLNTTLCLLVTSHAWLCARGKAVPQLSVVAHATDVNVMSWSAQSTFMLASGGDDGTLRVWDLRMFGRDAAANEASYVANFTYHRHVSHLSLRRIRHFCASQSFGACQAAIGRTVVFALDVARQAAAGLGFNRVALQDANEHMTAASWAFLLRSGLCSR